MKIENRKEMKKKKKKKKKAMSSKKLYLGLFDDTLHAVAVSKKYKRRGP